MYLFKNIFKMAKAKAKGSSNGVKVTFGKNKGKGKFKKSYGPKSEKPKKYRGQGR
jgi:hypothetical protein